MNFINFKYQIYSNVNLGNWIIFFEKKLSFYINNEFIVTIKVILVRRMISEFYKKAFMLKMWL